MNESLAPRAGLRRSASAEGARQSVLVVDDIDANLVAMQALLEDMDCDVTTVRSGDDALRFLLRKQFAVMLLDVQMPNMDGYEVAYHARQNLATRDVPIIFVTALHPNETEMLRGYVSGAVDFLYKPVNPQILRSKVRVFLDLHQSKRQISEAKTALERSNQELQVLAETNRALAERFRGANEELERAYRELQATQAQLIQSAKMASLGELVAGVAHEINNPLAFAVSHLETVRRSLEKVRQAGPIPDAACKDWERAESRLGEMNMGLDRIRELVLKLRTFSRLDEGERKSVSIQESVDSVLTIVGHRLKGRIRVETTYGSPDRIDCYSSLLNQALMNLVTNAIDAISGEGSIEISTGAEAGEYRIAVSDSGHGIPSDIRERVLDPFFTTKPVGEGTGLGLSITYSIVKKHQGALELRDRPGGGTTVLIRLPLEGVAA
ncbi:MAG TPA: ATP-binding protein [Polyangiaceae bacterium]